MRFGGSMTSLILPKYLRSDMMVLALPCLGFRSPPLPRDTANEEERQLCQSAGSGRRRKNSAEAQRRRGLKKSSASRCLCGKMAVRAAAMLKDGTARSDPRPKKDGQPAGAFMPLQEAL